jgi:hypothetical protein
MAQSRSVEHQLNRPRKVNLIIHGMAPLIKMRQAYHPVSSSTPSSSSSLSIEPAESSKCEIMIAPTWPLHQLWSTVATAVAKTVLPGTRSSELHMTWNDLSIPYQISPTILSNSYAMDNLWFTDVYDPNWNYCDWLFLSNKDTDTSSIVDDDDDTDDALLRRPTIYVSYRPPAAVGVIFPISLIHSHSMTNQEIGVSSSWQVWHFKLRIEHEIGVYAAIQQLIVQSSGRILADHERGLDTL